MKTLKIKKLVEHATLPTRGHSTDAGLDLYAVEDIFIPQGVTTKISTGIAADIPEGYFIKIEDRSSMAIKGLRTGAGIVDSGYQGEMCVVLHNFSCQIDLECAHQEGFGTIYQSGYRIRSGDKIAQMIVHKIELPEVEEIDGFDVTERSTSGWGSTGR